MTLISSDFSSPNYDKRPDGVAIDFIILHYTDMTFNGALERLCDPVAKVSAHYLIREDGEVFQLVSDEMRAWHAGKSFWRGREALNDCSIGIEIDNLGTGFFTDLQMEACIDLCKNLVDKYSIPPANVIGHSDIAPHRKLDPGIYFDWRKLSDHGLGIIAGDYEISDMSDIKAVQEKLAAIGYDLDITGEWDERTNGVVRAFQAHFCAQGLRKKGVEFYRDMDSRYSWNAESEKALRSICDYPRA